MEVVDSEYADYLHQCKINPFSISMIPEKENSKLIINTLNKEAYENIILPINLMEEFYLKHKNMTVKIKEKKLTTVSYDKFIKKHYVARKEFNINILTPLAFKQNNEYKIIPDFKLFFRSIMLKFDEFSENYKLYDPDTIDYINDNIKLVKYNLKTAVFFLHKNNIPGFLGSIKFYFDKNELISKLVNLLLSYSQYTGVGIKTSLGMGTISYSQPRSINKRKTSNK